MFLAIISSSKHLDTFLLSFASGKFIMYNILAHFKVLHKPRRLFQFSSFYFSFYSSDLTISNELPLSSIFFLLLDYICFWTPLVKFSIQLLYFFSFTICLFLSFFFWFASISLWIFPIYSLLFELAKEGKCIIIISSEIEELLGTTDRIFVMSQGTIKGQIKTSEASSEKIMKLSIGKENNE